MPTQNRRRTTLTTRLILEDADKILMLAQTKLNGDGFTLPGGKIEAMEFAKESLIRECKEEADIIIKKKDLQLAHIVYNKLKGSTEIVFFFSAKNWKNTPRIVEVEKFSDCIWVSRLEIPKKTTTVVKNALKRWFEGKIYSEIPKAKKKIAVKESASSSKRVMSKATKLKAKLTK